MSAPKIANGFNFENVKRNQFLAQKVPGLNNAVKMMKTGTEMFEIFIKSRIFQFSYFYQNFTELFCITLAGCIFDGGVVMGSDNRATAGDIIADKSCMKVHYMAPNIYCCGSGTSADCDQVTKMVSKSLELHSMETGREQVRLTTACRMLSQHLFNYQGHVSAGLILGGVDVNGPAVYSTDSKNKLKIWKIYENFLKNFKKLTKSKKFEFYIAITMENHKNGIF